MSSRGRVVITGVAGFIGSNLAVRLVKEGYTVIGIDNLSYGLREQIPSEVEFHEIDIQSKDIYPLFKEGDVVFHLAAKNSLLDCQNDPVGTMENNVVGTTNVFEAARRANVKKVIYAQSSVLEEGDDRLKGFYAISKMADEWIAEGYHAASGIVTVGLRYFQVYGPRQDYRRTTPPIMSKFIITLLKGDLPILFERDEENRRDFVHVDDVNDFHVSCVEDERVDNQVFRIGSGENHSIVEILALTQKIVGTNLEPVSRPRMKDDPPVVTLADITKARGMGWSPKVSLEEGLRSMVTYIQAEMAKGNIK